MVKFGCAVFELCGQTDRQTYRHGRQNSGDAESIINWPIAGVVGMNGAKPCPAAVTVSSVSRSPPRPMLLLLLLLMMMMVLMIVVVAVVRIEPHLTALGRREADLSSLLSQGRADPNHRRHRLHAAHPPHSLPPPPINHISGTVNQWVRCVCVCGCLDNNFWTTWPLAYSPIYLTCWFILTRHVIKVNIISHNSKWSNRCQPE